MGGGREEEGGKVSKVYKKKRALSTRHGSTLNTILNSKLFAQALGRLQVKKQ